MGCHNIYGYLSNLPIYEDDEIFCLISLIHKPTYSNGDLYFNNYQTPYMVPVYFPIFGKYDGSGHIKDIELDVDESVLQLQKLCINYDINYILEVIRDSFYHPVTYEKYHSILMKYLFGNTEFLFKDYQLAITFDHKKVYDIISNLNIDAAKSSYQLTIDNDYLLNDYYNSDEINKQVLSRENYLTHFELNSYTGDKEPMNPNIDVGYWGRFMQSMPSNYLLYILWHNKETAGFWRKEIWKDTYIKFMSFWRTCAMMCLSVTLHKLGNQEDNTEWHKQILSGYQEILNNK